MAQGVPRIVLEDLQVPSSGLVSPTFAATCETLALGLARSRVVIVSLCDSQAALMEEGMACMLASSTRSLPGSNVREWRAGELPTPAAIEEAYGIMDSVARIVLAALCRSSLLRLRSDAFSQMLDDLPLARSAQGSSCLAAKAFTDNFSHPSIAEATAVCSNLVADPQEEMSETGLISIFYTQEARSSTGCVLSAWQVKDSEGRWQGVTLGEDEVAVTLGHTMQHACTGLLQVGCHRVVGDPYAAAPPATGPHRATSSSGSGSWDSTGGTRRQQRMQPSLQGRKQLCFELRPLPAAVLDLRPQLEAAGHTISSRFPPMSVSCLMEKFALLSPAKLATPDQQKGAVAHLAWEEAQATLKKNKKRASTAAQLAATDRPVTRSGNVRRSAEGLVNQLRPSTRNKQAAAAGKGASGEAGGEMDCEGGAAAAAARRRSSGSARPGSSEDSGGGAAGCSNLGGSSLQRGRSMEPASSALYLVRGRTCTVVGSCLQDDPADCLSLCVRSFTGLERWFYCNAKLTHCGAMFEMYCARLGIGLGAVKFLLRGERVFGASTPDSLKMQDGEELTAVPDSTDRKQQARELGPLYAAVFGSQAASAAEGEETLAEMLMR